MNAKRKFDHNNDLVFLPLGGTGEIGMNCYCYGTGPIDDRQWLRNYGTAGHDTTRTSEPPGAIFTQVQAETTGTRSRASAKVRMKGSPKSTGGIVAPPVLNRQ